MSLAGWSIQYGSASGTTWSAFALPTATVQPGKYFLVKLGGGSVGPDLPAFDASGTLNLSATSGKVALVNTTTALGGACPSGSQIVDLVGYGSANCSETSPAATLDNTKAALRAGGGGVDSNSNAADFTAGTPTPRSSCYPDACATPTSTHTPPPSPTTGTTPGSVRIRDIQGAAHLSPYGGTPVSNVPGIVVARRGNGFYLQDPVPDANLATSEGIFVFTSTTPAVSVGDEVLVSGTVTEFRPGGSGGAENLTTTELTGPSYVVRSSGNPTPTPVVVGGAAGGEQRVPPQAVIDNDSSGSVETGSVFDPEQDGIDFWESLEGMLVQLADPVATGPTNDFGEIPLVSASAAGVRTTRGGVVIRPGDFNPERIIVDDAIVGSAGIPQVNVGATFSSPVVGVVDYSFENFKLLAVAPLTVAADPLTRESTASAAVGQLAIATFNVENLDANDPQPKFDALAALIVNNLKAPDLIVLEEIQDDNGPTNDAIVDAGATLARLRDAVIGAGGPAYEWRQVNPQDDQDGGEPGGNIRVVFFFRTDGGLSFVDRPLAAGDLATTPVSVVSGPDGPRLSHSPGRVDPQNAAWANTRKALAGEFTYAGQRFFVIGNHWSSKGGDQPLFGRYQPPALTSQPKRLLQAQSVRGFVDELFAADAGARIAILGDLNDFEFSPPVEALEAGSSAHPLHTLIETLPQAERYSYVFQGNSQALDHILLSRSLFELPREYDIVHVNSEFVDQASDHDPQLVRLTFPSSTPTPTPTATATSSPTGTPRPTNTPTQTPTLSPTDTPTATPTNTPTATFTATASATSTATAIPTATSTPTVRPTATRAVQREGERPGEARPGQRLRALIHSLTHSLTPVRQRRHSSSDDHS